MARHSKSLPLIKKYLLLYLRKRLHDVRGSFFSVRLKLNAFSTLHSRLSVGGAEDTRSDVVVSVPPEMVDFGNSGPDTAKFSNALSRNAVFCRLVRSDPGSLRRHHVQGEVGFQKSDTVVSIHEPMGASSGLESGGSGEPSVWVDTSSTVPW